ncbi:MAG: ATP-dependent Clp protease adapter ClpS [Proteobacteria bacterium]|nr:ATP-dependent Clp protease adapter ClpS [Pseudomonadota bacterium]MBU1739289.1 ATP-dependent Clp protease adapter ClpS [Pseudomonadota bacterium]
MSSVSRDNEGLVLTDLRQKVEEPPLYKVLLHNDDYTTMDFVVMVLEVVFHKNLQEATRIMLNVHKEGVGIAGVYSRDVAETKIALVHDMARHNDYPLKSSMEKA